ncbi:tripartite motif-containing protein 2-like [Glandiceps talaboti]
MDVGEECLLVESTTVQQMATRGNPTQLQRAPTLKETISEDLLQCSICLEEFQEPRCLPCHHTFCKECLQNLVKDLQSIDCPLCKQTFKLPKGGVTNLPSDHNIEQLNDIVVGNKSTPGMACQICQEGTTNAYGVCVECRKNICMQCIDEHGKIPATAAHRIIANEDSMVATSVAELSLNQFKIYCRKHNKYVVDLYCRSCNAAICVKCSIEMHGSVEHECVSLLGSVTKEHRDSLSSLYDSLAQKHAEIISCKEAYHNELHGKAKQLEIELASVDIHTGQTIEKVKNERDKLLEELKSVSGATKDILEAELYVYEANDVRISEALSHIDRLLMYGNAAQIVTSYPIVQQGATQLEGPDVPFNSDVIGASVLVANDIPVKDNMGRIVQVEPSLRIVHESVNLVKIGDQVHIGIKLEDPQNELMPLTERHIEAVIEQPDGSYQAIEVIESRKADGNEIFALKFKCTTHGIHKLSVKLGTSDINDSPHTFEVFPAWKHVDTVPGRVLGSSTLDKVQGIAVDHHRGKLLVSMSGSKSIHTLNYKSMKKSSWKTLTLECSGQPVWPQNLTMSDENKYYYIIDIVNNNIFVCDSKGKLVKIIGGGQLHLPLDIAIHESLNRVYVVNHAKKQIAIFTKDSGRYLTAFPDNDSEVCLDSPVALAVNSEGFVFVSDTTTHHIKVFNEDGVFVFAFGHHGNQEGQFDQPEGLTIDKHDSALVCDSGNNRVQKFDKRGRFVCFLVADNMEQPTAIAINHSNDNIIVVARNMLYVFQ